jgi:hypothetical protein
MKQLPKIYTKRKNSVLQELQEKANDGNVEVWSTVKKIKKTILKQAVEAHKDVEHWRSHVT